MGVTKCYEIVKLNWALGNLTHEQRFYLESQLLPTWHSGKESACQGRRCKRRGFDPWVRKIPWSRKWQPIPVFLPRKSHGQKGLAAYTPQGCKESGETECRQTRFLHSNVIVFPFVGCEKIPLHCANINFHPKVR